MVCGICCQQYQEIGKRAVREGHQIGSHSHRHPAHLSITNDSIVSEYNYGCRTIKQQLGVDVCYFRFPQFSYNSTIQQWITNKGLQDVEAAINAKDWMPSRTATQVREWIVSQLEPDSANVVVLHVLPTPICPVPTCGYIHTNEMLAQLIAECRTLGYEFYLLNPTIDYNSLNWIDPTN